MFYGLYSRVWKIYFYSQIQYQFRDKAASSILININGKPIEQSLFVDLT